MKPLEIYVVSLWLQTTLCMGACNDRDYDENLHAYFQCASETSLHFYLDKFECACIPFTSHIIGADGLQTDSHKFDSILSLDLSTSLVTLQEFLRIVQLAFTAARLRSLTKKTSEFVWSTEHQSGVDCIKKVITTPTSLQYLDSTQPVTGGECSNETVATYEN